jgi:hypothetical protein
MDAIKQWLASQAHLRDALSTFHTACTTLQTAIYHPIHPAYTQNLVEDAISAVQSQLGAIERMEGTILESRFRLYGLLNASPSRVPIKKLPAEILSHIFEIAISSSSSHSPPNQHQPLLAISLVCTWWREMAINTPSLWSHINIHIGTSLEDCIPPSLKHTRLCLDRAHGVPIRLQFFVKSYAVGEGVVAQIFSILQPHAALIVSLNFSGQHEQHVIRAFFSLYFRYGTPGLMTSLVLSVIPNQPNTFEWPTGSLRGLVDLQISDLEYTACPSFPELVTILSSSPLLHTLRLRHLRFFSSEIPEQIKITLPRLRVLDLIDLECSFVTHLLPLLFPGPQELIIRIDLIDDTAAIMGLQSLFGRSNVVSLLIWNTKAKKDILPSHLNSFLISLPSLRVLLLDLIYDGDCMSLETLMVTTDNGISPRCPNLRSLCFIGGRIKPIGRERMKQVVATYSLRSLVFARCGFLEQVANGNAVDEGRYRTMPRDLKEWFSQRVESFEPEYWISPHFDMQGLDMFVSTLLE